jgi:hypothetical protein
MKITFRNFIPLIAAVVVLVLLNVGLYAILPPPQVASDLGASRAFQLDFDGQYYTLGFYGGETDGDSTFKWTSRPQAQINLPLTTRTDVRLRFDVYNAIDPTLYDSLRVTANHVDIPLTVIDADAHMYEGMIAADVLAQSGEYLELRFITPFVRSPREADPDSADGRVLGIALDWLSIQPITVEGVIYEFDAQTPLNPDHWYGVETIGSEGATFRWSSVTDADVMLQIPRDVPFTLELGVIDVIGETLDLRAALNGQPLALTLEERDDRHVFTARIPAQASDSAVLTLSVPQVIAPSQNNPDSGDNRPLGVSMDWIRIVQDDV